MNERQADISSYDEVGAANRTPALRCARSEDGRPVLHGRYRRHFESLWTGDRTVDVLADDVLDLLRAELETDSRIARTAARLLDEHGSRLREASPG